MATDLIAIVGPTASGKTALAIETAKRFNGEIICADSRTIYTGMNIGTAKPSTAEQAVVPHWGLDLVEPDSPFSAADFKRYADAAISDIRARGKLPILVGGTGLYVDSVLYDFTFAPKADEVRRDWLEAMSIEELQNHCRERNIKLPANDQNKRHLVRAIERAGGEEVKKSTLPEAVAVVGIATAMSTLRTRIVERTEHLFANGVVDEAIMLGKKYGWDSEAMSGNIYPLINLHLQGELTIDEVKDRFITADYQLAKRQMTWFRRNPDIMWCDLTGAGEYIQSLLVAE